MRALNMTRYKIYQLMYSEFDIILLCYTEYNIQVQHYKREKTDTN